MTKNETAQIMAVLKAAYPSYYANQKGQDVKSAVELWHEMFTGDDAQLVAAAVKAYINADTKGFPPSIGQIRDKINLLTRTEAMTEQVAETMGYQDVRHVYRLHKRALVAAEKVLHKKIS